MLQILQKYEKYDCRLDDVRNKFKSVRMLCFQVIFWIHVRSSNNREQHKVS